MRFEDICVINQEGKEVFFPEEKKPTGEMPFHTRILSKRTDVCAIAHAHTPVITGFAVAHSDILSKPILPEPIIEVGPMLNVKYAAPLSDELSEAFDEVIFKSNGFVMENHGALVCSAINITEAVEQMEMYEAMATSITVSKIIGETHILGENDVCDLEKVASVRNLSIPGEKNDKTLRDVYGF